MDEIEAEDAVSLPNKEVLSLLDVNADVDLGLDLAAPIDLAAAANLNVAAPIEAAASANLLSADAEAVAVAQQSGSLSQSLTGVSADAVANQDASITQSADAGEGAPDDATGGAATTGDSTEPVPPTEPGEPVGTGSGTVGEAVGGSTGAVGETVGGATGAAAAADDVAAPVVGGVDAFLDGGSLLSANVNVDADANLTAPVAGAVAANANVAAPIDAAVAANIASPGAVAQAAAVQNLDISQTMEDVEANATADQDADVDQ
jgi:hypothetical protein